MFKFLAPAVLALGAFSAQAAIGHHGFSNGPAEHGIAIGLPGKGCPTRSCSGTDEPNGAADHGAILILEVPGKNCPTRSCGGQEDPNGRSEHGMI